MRIPLTFTAVFFLLAPAVVALPAPGIPSCRGEVALFAYVHDGVGLPSTEITICMALGPNSELEPRRLPPGTVAIAARYLLAVGESGPVAFHIRGLGIDGTFQGRATSQTAWDGPVLPIDADAAGTIAVTAVRPSTGAIFGSTTYTTDGTPIYDGQCKDVWVFSRAHSAVPEHVMADIGETPCRTSQPFLQPGAAQVQLLYPASWCNPAAPMRASIVGMGLSGSWAMGCYRPPAPYTGLYHATPWIDLPLRSGHLDIATFEPSGAQRESVRVYSADRWVVEGV